jgi:hypothetical protein
MMLLDLLNKEGWDLQTCSMHIGSWGVYVYNVTANTRKKDTAWKA